jgi:hypothetical protein
VKTAYAKDDFTKAQQKFWSARCQERIDMNNALWLNAAHAALAGDPKPLQERVALIGVLAPKAEPSR